MDFQTWLRAFDASLKAAGSGFTSSMYATGDVQAAWSNGVSPVIAARQALAGQFNMAGAAVLSTPGAAPFAMPVRKSIAVPAPNRKMLAFLHVLFRVCAYLIWGIGALFVLIYLFGALGMFGTAVADSRKNPDGVGGVAFVAALSLPYMAAWAFGMMVAGGVWMFISVLICLLTGIHDNQ
jgi:hypothetical protein